MIQLEEDKRDLERQLRETKANAEAAEKKLNEQRQVEERKHMEEINFLKKTNQQLKVRFHVLFKHFSHPSSFLLGSIGRSDRSEEINKNLNHAAIIFSFFSFSLCLINHPSKEKRHSLSTQSSLIHF